MVSTRDSETAARALAAGHLAILPTETVYGLGARADDPRAVARIYAAKGRPADHPLIAHLHSPASLTAWARCTPDYATALADAFWPGPLTLVVPRSPRAGDWITGGQDAVALRVSSHPTMLEVGRILAELTADDGIAIVAPSANRFGRVSPTTAAHALAELADVLTGDDVVLDGGACEVGVESTIVDCTGPTPNLLRPGFIAEADLESACGLPLSHSSTIRASGTLPSHYAPAARVRIVSELHDQPSAGTPTSGLIALALTPTPAGIVRLTSPETNQEYARVLYAAMREADALGLAEILVVLPDSEGVGAAIRDRVERAAAAR